MNVGDRVVLSARVRLDVGEGVYAVDIPSYPALYRIRPRRKPKKNDPTGDDFVRELLMRSRN